MENKIIEVKPLVMHVPKADLVQEKIFNQVSKDYKLEEKKLYFSDKTAQL